MSGLTVTFKYKLSLLTKQDGHRQNLAAACRTVGGGGWGGVLGLATSHLVHAVILHPEFSSVSVRGIGHGLQLLLLQRGVLRRHRLPQPVDAVNTGQSQDAHVHARRAAVNTNRSASSLDVLLMSRARHRLGPPALLLL